MRRNVSHWSWVHDKLSEALCLSKLPPTSLPTFLRWELVSTVCGWRKGRHDLSMLMVSDRAKIPSKDWRTPKPQTSDLPLEPDPRPGIPELSNRTLGRLKATLVPCGGWRFVHHYFSGSPRTQLGTGALWRLLEQLPEKSSTAQAERKSLGGLGVGERQRTHTCRHTSGKTFMCV